MWNERTRYKGTRWETVSFDPNEGNWRVEPIPLGYVQCLRISPSGNVAGYFRGRYQDEAQAYRDEGITCLLDGSSKEVSLSFYGGGSLTWAPDSKRLIVTTCGYKLVNNQPVLRTQAWLVNADGPGQTKLPIPDTHEVLDWAADGKFLLTYVPPRTQPRAAIPDFPSALYVMHPDGTGVRRVTPEGAESWYGRISPDSAKIAYQTYQEDSDPSHAVRQGTIPRWSVSVMSSDGSGHKEVIRNDAIGLPMHMCWSPDGKYLAIQIHKWRKTLGGAVFPPESRIDVYDLTGRRIRTLAAPEDGEFCGGASIDWR